MPGWRAAALMPNPRAKLGREGGRQRCRLPADYPATAALRQSSPDAPARFRADCLVRTVACRPGGHSPCSLPFGSVYYAKWQKG